MSAMSRPTRPSTTTKILLLLPTVVSFTPQLYRLVSRRDASGIALTYILFNLIVATEQFTLGLHIIAVEKFDDPGLAHDPPSFGDWLNLCQFGAVWLCHTILFLCWLVLPPSRSAQKVGAIAIYLSFLFISLVLVFFESTLPPSTAHSTPYTDRRWFAAIFGGIHSMFINPVVTMIGLVSVVAQALETSSGTSPRALSTTGLIVQIVVFTLVGISWLSRSTISDEMYWQLSSMRALVIWYQLVGWAAVDNFVFAFVQAVLLPIALRQDHKLGSDGEVAPLLS